MPLGHDVVALHSLTMSLGHGTAALQLSPPRLSIVDRGAGEGRQSTQRPHWAGT